MRWNITLFITLLFCASIHSQLITKNENPGSLWSDQTLNPLVDRTAKKEGDLITVIISETSSASFQADTTLTKADNNLVQQISNYAIINRFFRPFQTVDSGLTKGTGVTNRTGTLSAQFTVVVKEVLSNHRLRIEGTRSIVVNRETQTYILSGIIRRDDIQPNNTIASTSIAEAKIEMVGNGAIHDRQRRGILTRILDWLF